MRVIAVVSALAATAGAQPAPENLDTNAAEVLFEEGRDALQAGNPDLACQKFEQSIRKDPRAIGTLLNLGLCNERQGKVASALALFIEAHDRAVESQENAYQQAANEHIVTLRAQVPILVIEHPAAPLHDEKLLLDDRVVALDAREIPVDPGPHTMTLTAPGRLPFETSISVKVSTREKVRLPELQIPKQGVVRLRDSWRRNWGRPMTLGGGGLTLVGIAGIFFAKNRYDSQFDDPDGSGPELPHCGERPTIGGREVCDATGRHSVDSARTIAAVSTVLGAVGAVAAVAGGYLWWSAPDAVVVAPAVDREHAGVVLSGRF